MGHTIEEKARQKENEKCIKELSMEGFPPTMLGVVFLKELQIIRKGSDRQGLFGSTPNIVENVFLKRAERYEKLLCRP